MTVLLCTRRIRPIYFILMAIVLLQYCSANNPVCTNKECKNLANMYVQNMDRNINPCTNFYEFACNGWQRKFAKSWSQSFWDIQEQMEESMYYDLKKIMESKNPVHDKEFQQARRLYKINMNSPSLTRSDVSSLKGIMSNMAIWPMLYANRRHPPITQRCFDIDKQYITITGLSAFFDYRIVTDENNYDDIITDLRRLVSPYGSLLRFANWGDTEIKQYVSFLTRIIIKMSPVNNKPPTNEVLKEIHEVIQFREDMRAIIKSAHPHVTVDMTIHEFQEWYNLQAGSRKNTEINWLKTIRAIYNSENLHSSIIKPTSKVKVNKKYFKGLSNLLAKTGIEVLANHMHLYFVERHIVLDEHMIGNLILTIDSGANPTGSLIREVPKWRSALENHNMRHALGKMYVEAYFPKQKQNDVNELFQEAKRLLEHQILNSNWLNDKVKQKSVRKIKNVKNVIGYPKWYEKAVPTPPNVENTMNPLTVDIFYDFSKNSISATAAHLQLPFYGQTLPFPIDYGAAISVIGHELYHAFDPDGIQFDENAKCPWWPDEARNTHTTQLQCFKEQYEAININQFKKYHLIHDKDAPSTLDEDYADVMGLRLAYMGYKQKLQQNKGICHTLPGFETFSCDQLFFLAFANLYCTHATPNVIQHHLLKETHSLPEVRVNTALGNIRQFNAAFGCKPSDRMKLKKTCDVWKR